MNFKEVNEEVLYTDDIITCVTQRDIETLKAKASCNKRKRVRLCSHRNINDAVHEMLIVHCRDIYVRPHKHIDKSESFHIIEGRLNVIIFDDLGKIYKVINMGEYLSGKCFYYRLSDNYFHTLIPQSEFVVFHETTSGPFQKKNTKFADWSPSEEDNDAQKTYLNNLDKFLKMYQRELHP